MANIAICHNPLNLASREYFQADGVIGQFAPNTVLPVICLVNGEPTLRRDWGRQLKDTDVVVFATMPLGGGGGGGKNPLQIVLQVALFAVSGAAPGFFGVTNQFASALISGAILVGGGALISKLVPPPQLPSNQFGGLSAPSPTYNIAAQGNSARLGQAIPVIYGRHIVFPDFAAQPWTEFVDNQQFLVQTFLITQGRATLSDIKIEDTSIDSYLEVEYHVRGPQQGGGGLPYSTDIVSAIEVSGQELVRMATADAPPITNGTSPRYFFNGTRIAIPVGPFVANPSQTLTDRLYIDIQFPQGVYKTDPATGEAVNAIARVRSFYRRIDDQGAPIGGFIQLPVYEIETATRDAIRVTLEHTVPLGRYEVYLVSAQDYIRSGTTESALLTVNLCQWVGLRARIQAPALDTTKYTFLQTRIRATNQINQSTARRINCIAERYIQEWSPDTGWSAFKPSRSVIWAMVDALRNPQYGGKVADNRINLNVLHNISLGLDARMDYFDAIFDGKITLWEAMQQIARAGRTVPILQSGSITAVRDSIRLVPVALFGMRNIIKGSLSMTYEMVSEDSADAVEVEYFDARFWKPVKVKVVQPGGDGNKVSSVKLFGVTDFSHAQREARYLAATNALRRVTVRFSTEMEGFIPSFGDAILISHDMPRWGVSGDVIAYNSATNTLTLSEGVTFDSGMAYILLTDVDGLVTGPYEVLPGAADNQVIVQDLLEVVPYTGTDYERTKFAFGNDTENFYRKAKVTSISPRTPETVEITCVLENDEVYAFAGDFEFPEQQARLGRYAPDTVTVDYSDADAITRENYGFYSNNDGRMLNGDNGYTYSGD